ncbi:MAG: TcdA/TcdB catalytic glycosyltransferase domain-containing protein [Scandinavium sp.]|uniref:TcdA/TcdB catalytic glycosyltransferase domain-containing protein n=1 Tax=Scandinavium sp. TaxID=2830653 RepID=UPI003F33D4C0
MKPELSELRCDQGIKVTVPDLIHFVWIGDSSQLNIDYIDIWQNANTDKTVYLWLDESALACRYFHESIHEYVLGKACGDHLSTEMRIKNDAFGYLFPRLEEGRPFDELVAEFLSGYGIPRNVSVETPLTERLNNRNIIIRDVMEVLTPEFKDFKRYYYYEIILRGNLACASDIARLLILYQHGGVYIDVDTLPYTDNAFNGVNQFLDRKGIDEDDFLCLMKTRAVLKRIAELSSAGGEYFCFNTTGERHIESGLARKDVEDIQRRIDLDMSAFSFDDITPLGRVQVYKNLLALGSLRRFKGVYFNHFMASHPGSKALRIILRVMKRRYKFLEENNVIFAKYNGGGEGLYLSRILTWRTELITKNYCVTPVLTGPGLIVEVLLGLAYQLFDLTGVEPSFVAEFFQDEKYGIALYQHNLYTADGFSSTWRK